METKSKSINVLVFSHWVHLCPWLVLILPENKTPKNEEPKPWLWAWLYRLQKCNSIMPKVSECNAKHEYAIIWAKRCRNHRVGFHVQSLVRGHLLRVSGDEKAWFWLVSLQGIASKGLVSSFCFESSSNVDFDPPLFHTFSKLCMAVSEMLSACSWCVWLVQVL